MKRGVMLLPYAADTLPRGIYTPSGAPIPADWRAVLARAAQNTPTRPRASAHSRRPGTVQAIEGLAAPYWRVRSDDCRTVLKPGCFSASLTGGDTIRALLGHESASLLCTNSDRLELIEDDKGLFFRLELRDRDVDREAAALARTGRAGVSVGWRNQSTEQIVAGGHKLTLVTRAELIEISLLSSPAWTETSAALIQDVRSAPSLRESVRSGRLQRAAATESASARFARTLDRLQKALQ